MQKAITETLLERTRLPKAGRLEIHDTVQPGLSVRITAGGLKTFTVSYRVRGQTKKRRDTLGRWPAKGLKEAREEARRKVAAAASGAAPGALETKQKAEAKAAEDRKRLHFFEDAAEEFLTTYVVAKHSDPREARGYFKRHLLPEWRGMPLTLISAPMVEAITAPLLEAGKKTAAVRLHGHVRKFFRWAVTRNLIPASPLADSTPPATLDTRARVLDSDELLAVWKAAGQQGYPYGTFWQLMFLTGGQRLSDVAGMRWDDLHGDLWKIPEPTKSDTPHTVPLSLMAQEILRGIGRQRGPYVLSTTKGAKAIVPGSKAKTDLDTLSEVTGWRYHDTRRTVSTLLADLGEPPHVAEVLQNRRSIVSGVVATYNRSQYESDKRRAVELLAKHITELITGTVQPMPKSGSAAGGR